MDNFLKAIMPGKNTKSICINPVDEDMRILVDSLNILNEFKRLGFVTRSGFIGVVQLHLEEFKDYANLTRLFQFWAGRLKDQELNDQLNQLVNKLKDE